MSNAPKVCVVTPVFNGGRFLADAIESVRAQSYRNWEYIIADNCSTDDTVAIAQRYAALDPRIRVVRTEPHLPVIANWNRALRLVPADCAYIKELHADDLLLPNCLSEMVRFLESHPTAAIVSSYEMYDAAVSNTGVPLGQSLLPGDHVIARTLLNEWYLFGSPSSVMLRAERVRAMGERYYDESLRHADIDACFRMIKGRDFGFIHQVLSCTRTHGESQTNTFTARYSTIVLESLCLLRKYGPDQLDQDTYRRTHRAALWHYRRRIARRLIGGGGPSYWRYHRDKLTGFGYRLGPRDVVFGIAAELTLWAVDLRHAGRSTAKLSRKIARSLRAHIGKKDGEGRRSWLARPAALGSSFVKSLFG